MNFLKRRFAHAPEGTAVLFFIQIFSTLGFAVLYSTLVFYATKHLQLSVKAATTSTACLAPSTTASRPLPLEPESLRRATNPEHVKLLGASLPIIATVADPPDGA